MAEDFAAYILPQDLAVGNKNFSTSNLLPSHAQELEEKSGIPAEIALAHGWRSVSAEEARELLGWGDVPSGGIFMPYPGTDGFFRIRFDSPPPGGGKYAQPRELPRLFVPALPVMEEALRRESQAAIYVTEGEKKALCAAVRGLPTVGLGGVRSWGKGGELLPDWDNIPIEGRVFVLIGDSDLRGRPAADSAANALPELAEKLYLRGAQSVRVVYLPGPAYGEEGGKVGLDDFLAVQGRSVEEFLEIARNTPEHLPRSRGALEVLAARCVEVAQEGLKRAYTLGQNPWDTVRPLLPLLARLEGAGGLVQPHLAALVKAAGKGLSKRELAQAVRQVRAQEAAEGLQPVTLAQQMQEQYHSFTLIETQTIHIYENGYYRPINELEAKNMILNEINGDKKKKTSFVNEVYGLWEVMRLREEDELNPEGMRLINLENGMLDLETNELYPHDPRYLSTIRLPLQYNPEAKCPNVEKFLQEVLYPDAIDLILEFIGYCLLPTTKFEKELLLVGTAANGKSTFLKLLEKFLGETNVTHIPLQEIAENRFKRACLRGKLANIFADLSPREVEDSSYLKTLVSGDKIDGELKFKDPFSFRPFAKLVFSANELPPSRDKTPAWYRRLLITEFPNTFPEDARDTGLIEKITTEEELSGLLNMVLPALRRLLERGRFEVPESAARQMEAYRIRNDNVLAFLADATEKKEGCKILKSELYGLYKTFCRENQYRPLSAQKFIEKITSLGYKISINEGVKYVNGINITDTELLAANQKEKGGKKEDQLFPGLPF